MPLEYVGIRVTNLERSLRFYTRALGLREKVRGDDRSQGKGVWVGLTDPTTKVKLELNWYPPSSIFSVPFVPGEGLDHLGFSLGPVSRAKLESEYRRLIKEGGRPTPVTPDTTGGWQACVQDPDGNWIELYRQPTRREASAESRAPSGPDAARHRTRRRPRNSAAAAG